MKKQDRFKFWEKVRDQIDASIEKREGKEKLYHLAKYTGTTRPIGHVVLDDGEEIPYSFDQEEVLKDALDFRMSDDGKKEDMVAIDKKLAKIL